MIVLVTFNEAEHERKIVMFDPTQRKEHEILGEKFMNL